MAFSTGIKIQHPFPQDHQKFLWMIPWVVHIDYSGLVWLWMFQPQYGLVKYSVGVLSGGKITDFAGSRTVRRQRCSVYPLQLCGKDPAGNSASSGGLANVPEDTLESG